MGDEKTEEKTDEIADVATKTEDGDSTVAIADVDNDDGASADVEATSPWDLVAPRHEEDAEFARFAEAFDADAGLQKSPSASRIRSFVSLSRRRSSANARPLSTVFGRNKSTDPNSEI